MEHENRNFYEKLFSNQSDVLDTETVRQLLGGIGITTVWKLKVFSADIPHSVRAAETSAEGRSIYAHDSKGKVAEAYRILTKEVLDGEKQRCKRKAQEL